MAPMVKSPADNAEDGREVGSTPESGKIPQGRHGNPLQCSVLENPMDGRAWWAIVQGVVESDTTEVT